jgi:glycosyltransferase involved in cell wall biosynthesis
MAPFAMPPIAAILHTRNDALRLGRALESLRVCDEVLILDHESTDQTLRVAREYGAKVIPIRSKQAWQHVIPVERCRWFLLVQPSEAISEGLEAALYEWKLRSETDVAEITSCSVSLREEAPEGWGEPSPSTRLIPRDWQRWDGNLPQHDPRGMLLDGDLLRFRQP